MARQFAFAVPADSPQNVDANAPVARAPTTTLLAGALLFDWILCLPPELIRWLCFRCLDPRCFDAT